MVMTVGLVELNLDDPKPWVIQLYPEMSHDSREGHAWQLWSAVERAARDQPADPDAQMVCENVLGLFGNFLVLCPGDRISTKGIQIVLERMSRALSWDGRMPTSPHAVLLTPAQSRQRESLFWALMDVLHKSDPTIQDQDKQKLAAVLMPMFFAGHLKKVWELATDLAHQAKRVGSFRDD